MWLPCTATQAFYGSGNKWLRWALFSRQPWEYVNIHNENAVECLRPEVEREYSAWRGKEDCLNTQQLQYMKWGQNYKWLTSIHSSPKKTQSYRPWTKQCSVKMFTHQTQDAGCLFGLIWINVVKFWCWCCLAHAALSQCGCLISCWCSQH